MANSLQAGLICAGLGLAAGGLLFSRNDRTAAAQTTPASHVVPLEYTTVNLEPGTLQAKLTELGETGWQVFSIVNSDFVLDQTVEARPRLVVQRLEVTASRPRKP